MVRTRSEWMVYVATYATWARACLVSGPPASTAWCASPTRTSPNHQPSLPVTTRRRISTVTHTSPTTSPTSTRMLEPTPPWKSIPNTEARSRSTSIFPRMTDLRNSSSTRNMATKALSSNSIDGNRYSCLPISWAISKEWSLPRQTVLDRSFYFSPCDGFNSMTTAGRTSASSAVASTRSRSSVAC